VGLLGKLDFIKLDENIPNHIPQEVELFYNNL
jgi:hypothetical protein